uniref:Aminotransferase-like plant mobile domain-containing protein n=1 Tax=Arundo donax TaxID=35708 RepID=A0A0A9DIY2_ARUDO
MLPIYYRFVPRLNAAGLLPLCRLVQATTPEEGDDPAKRFMYDRSLLAALVDRWRPETHTFHLPVGEAAPTLEDVSFLLGLPCAGATVIGPDVSPTWREELEHRFAGTVRRVDAPMYWPTLPTEHYGPTKKWILLFWPQYMVEHPDDVTVSRHFEAYLLWLFGWTMFASTHGNVVAK